MTASILIRDALYLAQQGLPVFPLAARSKVPTKGSRGFHDATTDPAVIEGFDPAGNLGIATGKGIVVVDVDPRNGGDATLAKLVESQGELPETPCVQTGGGGQHYYFKANGHDLKCGAGVIGPGVDLKADGGYCVAPPSVHPSGDPYEWLVGPDTELAPIPEWLIPTKPATAEAPHNKPRRLNIGSDFESVSFEDCWQRARAGDRWHDHTLKMVAHCVGRGWSDAEVLALAAGLTLPGYIVDQTERELRVMIDGARAKGWGAQNQSHDETGFGPETAASTFAVKASTIAAKRVEWVWLNRIPAGKVSLIAGDPEAGKTTLALHMLALISRGGEWPDGTPCPRGHALVISAEDDKEDTLRPRLEAAGADLDRVCIADTSESLDSMLPKIDAWARAHEHPTAMIDPLGAFLGDRNSWKDQDVRALLGRYRGMCSDTGATVIGVAHLNKNVGTGSNALYRVMGGLGFVAAARAVWGVFKDEANPKRRLFLKVKNNLAPGDVGGLAYTIETGIHGQPLICWENGTIDVSADDAVQTDSRGYSERAEAREFLSEFLASGPKKVKDIQKEADNAGHAWRTIERAKRDLKINSKSMGFGMPHEWHRADCPCSQCVPAT